jgi:ABC-type glutathione transport system ATPase component
VTSGLTEVSELEAVVTMSIAKPSVARPAKPGQRFKGGSLVNQQARHGLWRTQVLKGVDLAVKPGTVTCVIGPSGSGKSTLLRCLNRLVEPKGETFCSMAKAFSQ